MKKKYNKRIVFFFQFPKHNVNSFNKNSKNKKYKDLLKILYKFIKILF